jgi:uncharacterized protein (TIGR02594 family)
MKLADLEPDDIPADIDQDEFARTCIDASRVHGVSPHYLIAVANQASDGIKNTASKVPGSDAFGPFQITKETWATGAPPLGFTSDDRVDPFAQCFVAAKMTGDHNEGLQAVMPDQRFPTGAELYCAWTFGLTPATVILGSGRDRTQSVQVALGDVFKTAPDKVAPFMDANAGLLKVNGQPRTIAQVIDAIVDLLDPGLKLAVTLIDKVAPGLFNAVPDATGAPGDTTNAPWMAVAKQELAKNIHEPSVEIDKYFSETSLGQGHEGATAWCAAFVSYCIKKSTNKPLHYSARAADWLQIGSQAPGPAFGVIAVTFPMVAGSSGHVGFVQSADDKRVMLLAGNQHPAGGGSDAVCVREFAIGKIRGFRSV